MSIIILDAFIKFIGINFCVHYSFFKILNQKIQGKTSNFFILFFCILLSIIECINSNTIYTPLKIISIYTLYSFVLNKISKNRLGISLISLIISLSLSYILYATSSFFIFIITVTLSINPTNPINFILIDCLQLLLIYVIFKIKRFKNGIPFIKNHNKDNNLELFLLSLCTIILFISFIIGNYKRLNVQYLSLSLLIFIIFLFITLQKTFIIYQNHKVLKSNIIQYEQELSETKQKLETALSEKRNLVQSNHEFYHRQKALSQKLDELMILQAHSADTEVSEEISDIIDRINKMSDEYKIKTHTLPNLEKCNIKSIDDMFSYMQYECYKNDIEFVLKYNCDINHIINNNINESQLETLLGDFIRNSIIAINHSENSYRSIMVVFGIKDDAYELCVFDSGIPFEINTLINLGLQPASTHLDEGGTGSGFISTFETINSCNASFIINEITGTNYTKSLEIKFDNKHEYIIISDRSNEIKKLNVSNRSIILK